MNKQEELLKAIVRCLSKSRLEPYFLNSLDDIPVALSRYLWNIALCESLYPILSFLEISLRNELHQKLALQFGTDWLVNEGSDLFRGEELTKIRQAKERLAFAKIQITCERLVPELNFGFWTSLFNGHYEKRIWRRIFLNRTEHKVFPFLPRRMRTRKQLSKRFDHIRKLRNRIFHHEPIWYRRDLAQTHSNILEAIYWISPELCSLVRHNDKFPRILKSGQRICAKKMEKFIPNYRKSSK